MLKMIALSAAVAVAAIVAPLPGSDAHAARESYRQCMVNANWYCLPVDSNGNRYIPNPGPEEDAYLACYEAAAALCATLPDAPE